MRGGQVRSPSAKNIEPDPRPDSAEDSLVFVIFMVTSMLSLRYGAKDSGHPWSSPQ